MVHVMPVGLPGTDTYGIPVWNTPARSEIFANAWLACVKSHPAATALQRPQRDTSPIGRDKVGVPPGSCARWQAGLLDSCR